MLISRVPEEGAGRGEPGAEIARNCQTASELFELMTKDHDFEAGDDPLTTSDLVLLYKNIDLGNQLMTNVRERSNQYVENVYHDDPETDSDLSESCSSEELRNIVLANKERIDLFNNPPSLNSLCHKLGDLEIQVSNISNDLYDDRHFLHKDPYIKEQLQNLQLMSKANELNTTLLPTSLLDYICCKRLEENYNFYMDNIITYVTHTIDQLKRISNGDYLPDKVKEKWRESDNDSMDDTSKVLTTSVSMPLQVKRKATGLSTAWDDIVHTEVDLRSLVKIMEKKIVLEVPRMISGSYKFLNKHRADKLVIRCSRRRSAGKLAQAEPRVDVVLSVKRAAAGQLVSNIDSIMVLQPKQQITQKDSTELLTLEYQNPEFIDTLTPKVIELQDVEQSNGSKSPKSDEFGSNCSLTEATDSGSKDKDSKLKDDNNSLSVVPRPGSPAVMAQILNTASRVVRAEAASNHATPNELNFSMTCLNRQTSLPEESTSDPFYIKAKKKSPERIRIKSPYENKSYILEERKRRKLLEVRERRERRKIASNENSKVSKHKAFPQAVSSVTKLSITNKAFYNSIYGRNVNGENTKRSTSAFNNMKARKGAQKIDEEIEHESEGDIEREEALPGKTLKKFKGHFLDDTETEISYLQSKQDSDFLRNSTSTSVDSNESTINLYPQSEYCSSLTSFHINAPQSPISLKKQRPEHEEADLKTQEALNKEHENTPKVDNDTAPAVECRRSLEKIYTLMKKLHQIETSESAKKKATPSESRGLRSESGSSLKRRVSFSNPRFDKHIDEINNEGDEDLPRVAVPKVVISAKQITQPEEKSRIKAKPLRVKTIPENPLKAISQLLHEFDNVQKSKPKIADPKSINRSMSTENAELVKIQKRRSRLEAPVKEDPKVIAKVKTRVVREERPEVVKPHVLDKKINDLIDEAKEARGEAVRGPARFSSRLNALAQPKRTYVQALAEEFPRRQTPERAQRPASHYSRTRRRTDGRLSPSSVRAPHSSLERTAKPRRSAASSPDQRLRESPQFATLAAAAANALHSLKEKPVAVDAAGSRRGAEQASPVRAPLLPRDAPLYSMSSCATDDVQLSSSIGLKLHRMVSAMLRAERSPPATTHAKRDPSPPSVATAIHEAPITTQIVAEKIVVENTEEVFTEETHEPSDDKLEDVKHAVTPANSVTELEMLEHALHRSLSSGAFGGRLRVNKLTLSPRPSLQRVVMHESGDTTLVLKSNLHQEIKVTCQASDQKTDLMGLLTKTRLNCGFTGFPLQISTVGYAFPTFQCEIQNITPRIIHRDMLGMSDAGTSCAVSEHLSSSSTVMEIKEEKKKSTCQCMADEPQALCVTTQVCAATKNVETNTTQGFTSEVPATEGKRDKEVSAPVVKENCQPSDYTTSFDILVGLLNEIQKMTTCESDAASAQTLGSVSSESSPGGSPTDTSSSHHSGDTVSNSNMSSDDRIGAFTPETKSVSAEAMEHKPVCEDKEVLVRVTPRNAAASTSQQAGFPNGIATSTYTNLPTSSCSVSAFTHCEYSDIGCNTSIQSGDKITKQVGIETNRTSVKSLVPYYNNMFKVVMKKDAMVAPENSVVTVTPRNVAAVCNILVDIAPVQKSKKSFGKGHEVEMNRNNKKEVKKFCPNKTDLDSTLKVKRDILVTFYSILVLTVFAALAFPELLQLA